MKKASHDDAARFWRDLDRVLADATPDQAFCVGLVCAAAMLDTQRPFPPLDVRQLAAEKDARLFHRLVIENVKAARFVRQSDGVQRAPGIEKIRLGTDGSTGG